GVDNIIYLSSVVLIAITAGYWMLFHGKARVFALAALPVALLLVPDKLPSVTRPDGTEVRLLLNSDSAYGQIKVVDYAYGDTRLREFLLENMVQGGMDVNTGLSISKYTYYIEHLANSYRKDAQRALVIGLGSGIIPGRFLEHYNIKTDVVEINPGVVETAGRYFSYDKSAHYTFTGDGRIFLKMDKSPYDIIVLDAFSGDTPPSHLISMEAFALMDKRLTEDGVLLINFVGSNQPEDSGVPASLHRTLREVFPRVDVYASPAYSLKDPMVVNLIFAASKKLTPLPEPPAVRPPVYPPFADDVSGLLERKVYFENGPYLFTDDYNPVDFADLRTREAFRYSTVSTADREIVAY
ncbi:MAG: fused MFS/spermidine synthase, partial [Deltaproteobacteria bacterium]|nr:fused MFS/spermidine synthase [Deltaproteobacteria bacterium]